MITIESFKGLPLEYESFLINRYESYLTTCRYIEIYHPDAEIYYALIYENNKLTDLLLFENKGDTTLCMNLLVHVDQMIISEFIKYIFENFQDIRKVQILLSYVPYTFKKSVLLLRNNDYIVNLPSGMDEYISMLGHSTRKTIRNLTSRLMRDYQNVNFITRIGGEIEGGIIEKIIQLNIARMKIKGITPGKETAEGKNIQTYSRHYGIVTYIEINGELVAGNIAFIINKRMFGLIGAHHENYSKYNVAKINQLYLIQTAIEKGLTTYHFLWGDNDYKKRFLGEAHPMDSYLVYRVFSFNFLATTVKTFIIRTVLQLKQSVFFKPIRNAIKSYRKNKMVALLIKCLYIYASYD